MLFVCEWKQHKKIEITENLKNVILYKVLSVLLDEWSNKADESHFIENKIMDVLCKSHFDIQYELKLFDVEGLILNCLTINWVKPDSRNSSLKYWDYLTWRILMK